ncbi:TfoX/Sxy family protein [Candidatus Pacebacteria bacterium]|nr:TfoX/Sxy family protein [Candidatus Paceibacterota bacterium]
MPKPIDTFHEYVVGDILAHVDGITSKRMFGGYGLYHDGAIFAIITSDSGLYFKVDDTNRAYYESIGSEQFIYTGHTSKKPTPMPYWIIPEAIMENREQIEKLVYDSAAITTRKTKKK